MIVNSSRLLCPPPTFFFLFAITQRSYFKYYFDVGTHVVVVKCKDIFIYSQKCHAVRGCLWVVPPHTWTPTRSKHPSCSRLLCYFTFLSPLPDLFHSLMSHTQKYDMTTAGASKHVPFERSTPLRLLMLGETKQRHRCCLFQFSPRTEHGPNTRLVSRSFHISGA